MKKILKVSGLVLAALVCAVAAFAGFNVYAFSSSMSRVYEVPLPAIARSTDPQVLARGRHLAESLGGCTSCHGASLSGGKVEEMGPIGRMRAPNLTRGKNGVGAAYTDAELARLLQQGIKRDGTSVTFMPSQDFAWWPQEDVVALISYVRTVPDADAEPAIVELSPMGKVLDRLDLMALDVARRIDHHQPPPPAPPVAETKEYGAQIAQLCKGCHGATLSGGPIPGAPPELAVPLNLTPHAEGLEQWTLADFKKLMREGVRKNGKKLDPFMPIDAMKNFDDVEVGALWAYLRSTPPRPFGGR
jgi:mono/diheme cytochrome c family protein